MGQTTNEQIISLIDHIGIETIENALNEAVLHAVGSFTAFQLSINHGRGDIEFESRDLIENMPAGSNPIAKAMFKKLRIVNWGGTSIQKAGDFDHSDDETEGIMVGLNWSYRHHTLGSNGTELGKVLILPDGQYRTRFVFDSD